MFGIVASIQAPGVKLGVRLSYKGIGEDRVGPIAGHFLRIFTQPLVDPSLFVAVICPMDHMLEFMG